LILTAHPEAPTMRWFDLAHPYHEGMTHIPAGGPPCIRKFSTPEYHTHPYLSLEAARWLLDRRVKMVGVDFFSADLPVLRRPKGFDWPVHHLLLGNGVLIAENLANLTALQGRRLTIGAFLLKIKGGDGAPARIFAMEL